MIKHFILVQIIVLSIIPKFIQAQEQPFSLDACIKYAWENSTEISRASNSVGIQNAYLAQSKAERGPNLFMNGSQTLNSSRSYENSDTGGSWKQNSSSKLSVSLNSEITLYNGAKLKNTIAQNKTNLAASETDIQTQKELISLNILSAYINALLTIENVKNSESQLQSTKKQFELAEARKSAGIISASDFLNIKSQYALDKALVINAKNTLRINYVALMQLMNMPINDSFSIQEPNVDALLKIASESDANLIYKIALGIQPTIKSAELYLESAKMDSKIAQAGALPQLSLGGSIGSGYSSDMTDVNFGDQFSNKINPSIGLSLSIPIFQRKKVKTNVTIANIQTQNEELILVDLKNDLRKYIEQACIDSQIASSNYLALQEQYDAEIESYQLSDEMFTQGMINSVDFLTSKNNLVSAENKLTQAKYNVLLQNKIIDYYIGNTILF
ncbi:TolC family protein [Labilibaculum sp. DW002]|uniref:TolC family protein n=1 Tax=Paralabilibaculum antarcticum TaxID=2912572 RepID=A0ABT5VWE7_9BACT|nr:TolC family protein [Labilibaculum sp. DW002]MDE5419641.1 TolC family protein [Labilibaculum sp. DW002]